MAPPLLLDKAGGVSARLGCANDPAIAATNTVRFANPARQKGVDGEGLPQFWSFRWFVFRPTFSDGSCSLF